ncbi:hypothetical protein ACFU5O_33540 [Streptomyces sp. NPDC057445]|uniref:hypothetical protein n=1 Tax=Streptomyces sp. NPDC057445 TaxID=3346136 RepID=UPI0036AC64C0
MGLFDRLTGTKRPAGDIAQQSAEHVRAALLGLSRPDLPYVVRDGAPEGAELVAEWRLMESAWQTFFVRSQVSRAVQIRMRLVPSSHEVRALDRQWEVTWVAGKPRLMMSPEYTRGQVHTVSKRWTIGRGADGGLETTETFCFDNTALKSPLQDAVLAAGWTWRAVVTGKL